MAKIVDNKDKHGKIISYRIMVCVGRDTNYKQVWRTKTIPRPEGLTPAKERKEVERQADAWELEVKAEYERTHKKENKENISFRAFVENHWLPDYVHDGQHKPTTIAFYENMAKPILDYFAPEGKPAKKLKQISMEDVKRFIKYMRTEARTQRGEPFSQSTIQHLYKTLSCILDYAKRSKYIKANPCDDLNENERPGLDNKPVDFLEPEEALEFLRCLEDEPLFWKTMMYVLIYTGLRRGEAIGLQWGDIDADSMTLSITRNVTIDKESESKLHVGTTKGNDGRIVPLPGLVYELLTQLKAEQTQKHGITLPSAYIFCNDDDAYKPTYPTEPTRWMRKFIKRHHLRSVSPHDLRHTTATLAIEGGATLKQVQELLGHKDYTVTVKHYAGLTRDAKRRTVEGIENILTKTS